MAAVNHHDDLFHGQRAAPTYRNFGAGSSDRAADKSFSLSIARVVNNQARALSISGVGGGPANDLDITLSPELNLVRVGNRGATGNLELKALSVTKSGHPVNRNLPAITVPDENDLAITVTDWSALDLQASPVRSAVPKKRSHILMVLLLTMQRRGELAKAEWTEFDFDNRRWRIPASHSKNKREHAVPLTSSAIAELKGYSYWRTGRVSYCRERIRRGMPIRSPSRGV